MALFEVTNMIPQTSSQLVPLQSPFIFDVSARCLGALPGKVLWETRLLIDGDSDNDLLLYQNEFMPSQDDDLEFELKTNPINIDKIQDKLRVGIYGLKHCLFSGSNLFCTIGYRLTLIVQENDEDPKWFYNLDAQPLIKRYLNDAF